MGKIHARSNRRLVFYTPRALTTDRNDCLSLLPSPIIISEYLLITRFSPKLVQPCSYRLRTCRPHSLSKISLMFFHSGSNASLPSQGFWGRFKTPKGGNQMDLKQAPPPQMTLSRQRLLTLAFGEMETVRMVSLSPHPMFVAATHAYDSFLQRTWCVSCNLPRVDMPRYR